MYSLLDEVTLKSGETMRIGVVEGPDPDWAPHVAPFLGHKDREYRNHINRALAAPLDNLQTRFYVGCVDDRIISQVMVVGDRGAGILGHVYTLPEERRKGACAAIFGHLMPHVAGAGFQVICLGTGFESAAYWIYHSYGFRSVAAGSGCMKWQRETQAEAGLLRPAAASIRDLEWGDWGFLDLLMLQPVALYEELPRSAVLGIKGQSSAEGAFAALQLRRERDPRIVARALVSETGATVGWALAAPDPRWFGDRWAVDIYAYPGFESYLPALLQSLDIPDVPVTAYLTTPEGPGAAAFRKSGWRPQAQLAHWLATGDERADLNLWVRDMPGECDGS